MTTQYLPEKRNENVNTEVAEIQNSASKRIGNGNRGLLAKLFPSPLDKENANHMLSLAKVEGGYREKALQIVKDAQLQSIEEMYNDWLISGKIDIRGRRAEVVLEQKNVLEAKIMELSNQFEDRILQEMERAEKLKNPMLREKKIRMVEASIESYYNLTHQLQAEFQNILNEGVKA